MAKTSKSSKKSSKKASKKAAQAHPLNGTWRITRFPEKNNFPPNTEPDGEFDLDIDNSTGVLKNTSKHRFSGNSELLIGRASAAAVRIGHGSGKRGYAGVLMPFTVTGRMVLAGSYRIKNIFADQEQGTWTGTKP